MSMYGKLADFEAGNSSLGSEEWKDDGSGGATMVGYEEARGEEGNGDSQLYNPEPRGASKPESSHFPIE